MDFYPTILDLASLPLKEDQHVDGKSFAGYIKYAEKYGDRTLVWHYPHYHGSTWRPGSAIRQNQWKLIEFYEDEKVELYNLDKDIEEQHDLSSQYPEKVQELKKAMHQYIDERGGRYPVRSQ